MNLSQKALKVSSRITCFAAEAAKGDLFDNSSAQLLTSSIKLPSSNILFAAESMVAQVNGMMCIKCQKMVTDALAKASPSAKVKVSWPEGVAVSAFEDKSNLNDEEFKKAILGTGFEVVKVTSVDKFIDDPGEAVSILSN